MSNLRLSDCQVSASICLLFAISISDAKRGKIERKTSQKPARHVARTDATRCEGERYVLRWPTQHVAFGFFARRIKR